MVSDPSKNVNACEDFLELVVTAHVLAAFMTILGMESPSDDPTSVLFPEGGTTEAILAGLLSVAQVVVNDHTDFSYPAHTSPASQKEFDSINEYA